VLCKQFSASLPEGWRADLSISPILLARSRSDQHALDRDELFGSRWAVNPKVRPGDHTFLMVK